MRCSVYCHSKYRFRESGNRRGVLLLVVLSMLTLFLLLGVAFIVLASRARTVSKAYLQLANEQQQSAKTLQPMVRDAAFQVIRGTQKQSGLKNHDLLGDRYSSAEPFTVLQTRSVNDNQLLELTLNQSISLDRTGCVLGFDKGPAVIQKTATRILDVSIDENNPSNPVVTIPWPSGLPVGQEGSLRQLEIRINNRDFGGSDIGTDKHRPNWSLVPTATPPYMNENYDAVDQENLALAEVDLSIASYQRRESVNYWLDWYAGQLDPVLTRNEAEDAVYELLSSDPSGLSGIQLRVIKEIRRSSSRPFAYDHVFVAGEDFSGKTFSNARTFFSLLRGESGFDVDSDGDGRQDSIWVDFGREAFRLPDRTLVKPLAAVRCIDLGGRINLNAHGSPAHYDGQAPASGDLLSNSNSSDPPVAADQPVGLGYGPADVRFDTVLTRDQIRSVFQGRSSDETTYIKGNGVFRRLRGVRGRYGSGSKTPGDRNDTAGNNQRDTTGQTSVSGLLPSDYSSRYAIGLDHRGHPLFLNWDSGSDDNENSPYELNLFQDNDCTPYEPLIQTTGAEYDQPFTAAEMESLFRLRDADNAALLPQRLLAIFIDSDPDILQLLTTASWDTPAIIGSIPTLDQGSSNLEIKRGLKLNLNRPFGDGSDNDNDGAIDDPNETSDPYFALNGSGWKLTRGETIGTENRQQPGPNVAGLRARQIMANNLFDVMITLQNAANLVQFDSDGLDNDLDGDVDESNEIGLTRRELAQWAVNVVDYIDADAIMTPFRYGDGIEELNVVWGCENPDLIITETLAFHDRAIADTDEDDEAADENDSRSAAKTTAVSPDVPDEDFDQIRVPQGSLFVELHATRNPLADRLPRELYSGTKGSWELELGKIPSGGSSPVWRLSFGDLRSAGTVSNDPFRKLHEQPDATLVSTYDPITGVFAPGDFPVNRYGYFTKDVELPNWTGNTHKPNKFNTFVPTDNETLRCGGYLVAGPRSKTFLGSTSAGVGQHSDQSIEILSNGVRKVDLDESVADTTVFSESFGCVLQAEGPGWDEDLNHEIGLNVSEPNGYEYYLPPSSSQPDPPYATPSYGPSYKDIPQDVLPTSLKSQGTHINASTVFLERLADPTRPFEPNANLIGWNPYIVVDFAAIDLTVFNGETSEDDPSVEALTPKTPMYAHTRQRGFDSWIDQDSAGDNSELFSLSKVLDGDSDRILSKNLWRPCSPYEKDGNDWKQRPPQWKVSAGNSTNAFFNYDIGASENDTIPTHTLGWCNLSQGRRGSFGSNYIGVPESPFPWLGWKDGPLANPYELLLVPRTSASRLLTNYRDVGELTDADGAYKNAADVSKPYGVDNDQPFGATRPGHHLLPLTSITDRPLDPADPKTPAADALSKVFGYVRTPSPFAGTRTEMRTHKDNGDICTDTPEHFQEPFNQIETYREPGKINLNTIRDQRVWNALTGDTGIGLQPGWSDINDTFTGQNNLVRTAANGRSNTLLADSNSVIGIPLFPTPTNDEQVAFDPGRSSWFRFAPLMRTAANSTARSEVYAIWVTVGLFEVESTGNLGVGVVDPYEEQGPLIQRFPGGHRILREYGQSTGEVKRYRGFYIFDRSRPIVYEPGVNHNVEDGILVERFIQ